MSQNKYIKVPIKGMHCRSCELLIEENLKEISHVKSVEVDYKTGEAFVYYEGQTPNQDIINKAICAAGYEIGHSDKLPLLSTDKKEYISLGIAFLILITVFFVLKGTGLFNINLGSNLSNPSWGLIILIGLVAGFSTCMALIGGLSLGLSTKFIESHPKATTSEKFRPHLFFMLGRIGSYAFLGGLLGLLGTVFKLSTLTNSILTILVGLVMLVMGLQLIDIFPRLSNFKFSLPKNVAKAFGFRGKTKEYSNWNAVILGALTFFLPCGFTQAVQLYAVSTGDFWSGAVIMGLFAIGTAPGLLSIGGLTALVKGKFKARFFKVAGLAVIFFAVFNLSNGYTLVNLSVSGFSGSNLSVVSDSNVILENGVQVIHMVEGNDGYSPNSFSIKKGVPVKWIIDAQAPYSCASAIIVPKLNISKNLEAGENIIEFTPTQSGKIPFSCSMGMYTGVFNVYDENSSAVVDTAPAPVARTSGTCGIAPASTGGSCGGGSAAPAKASCGCGGGSSCSGGAKIVSNTTDAPAVESNDVQVIKTIYTVSGDLQPNSFTVKAGKPVRFEVYAKEDGVGCMGTIQIQSLYENIQSFKVGETVVMEFTPKTSGSYLITCAMNMLHGTLRVQ
jgi:sulfite exporter TauE/SafE/copper chaperone CopZ/plastocyanin